MARFGTYRNDPREITAKFDSVCAETGKPIKKGERCIYYPLAGKVYGIDTNTARQFYSERFDNDVLGANY